MLNNKFNRQFKLILCTCFMSYFQFIIGCSFIFSSILIAKLKEPQSPIKIDSESASWIASVPLLVCPIGLIGIGILTDKIGRRKALQIAYVPNILSWLVLAYANTFETVIIGRILLGTTIGSSTSALLYLAEVCPTKYRPLAFSVTTMFVGMGMMCGCGFAMLFCLRTICLLLFAMSAAGCVSLFLVPESPMWLRSNGRTREAEAAEQWLGAPRPAAADGRETPADGRDAPADGREAPADAPADGRDAPADDAPPRPAAASWWTLVRQPTVWKPTVITLMFFVCQQCCGFYVLLFYSVDVLRDCHVQWDGITVTMFLSMSRVVGSLTFSALHGVRRKTLTVVSSSAMAVSLGVIVAYIWAYKNVADPPHDELLIVAFVAYMYFTMMAMLPLPWTLCGEVFPMAIKGIMSGIVQTCGYELMFFVLKIYPTLISIFGIEIVWSVFTGFCVASALFGAFIMPETKGKSLDEILKSFESHKKSIKNNLP